MTALKGIRGEGPACRPLHWSHRPDPNAKELSDAARGAQGLDVLIRGASVVNVYDSTVRVGDIGVLGSRIACVGDLSDREATLVIDARGFFAIPGFVDSHMHLESSMLTPAAFAHVALTCGTTTCLADPHEIANVCGLEGVRALTEAAQGLPLRVFVCTPSTIPSALGLEGSGFEVDASQIDEFARELPQTIALGEVMDFNAVADGDERMLGVIERAKDYGWIIDGHASALTGTRLQAFRAAGITSDHTCPSAEKLREELALGFTVQIQDCCLSKSMVEAMNEAEPSNRICLVTDDVPLSTLMHEGHLNHVVAHAIDLGLDPLRAIRFSTVNAAERLGAHDMGAIAPGMLADLQLVGDLRHPEPEWLLVDGEPVVREEKLVMEIPGNDFPESLYQTMQIGRVSKTDFEIPAPEGARETVTLNTIQANRSSFSTELVQRDYPVASGGAENHRIVDVSSDLKIAVFNRHGSASRTVGVLTGMSSVEGAVATSYAHDSHNLVVYGGSDADCALAANTVIEMGGGLCATSGQEVLARVPLPIAGLLSESSPEQLLQEIDGFLEQARRLGFEHERLLSFFSLMALAVSPKAKISDYGIVDVTGRRLLPVVAREGGVRDEA